MDVVSTAAGTPPLESPSGGKVSSATALPTCPVPTPPMPPLLLAAAEQAVVPMAPTAPAVVFTSAPAVDAAAAALQPEGGVASSVDHLPQPQPVPAAGAADTAQAQPSPSAPAPPSAVTGSTTARPLSLDSSAQPLPPPPPSAGPWLFTPAQVTLAQLAAAHPSLVPYAPPPLTALPPDLAAYITQTCLDPIFTQFLAWQRLMQVQAQIRGIYEYYVRPETAGTLLPQPGSHPVAATMPPAAAAGESNADGGGAGADVGPSGSPTASTRSSALVAGVSASAAMGRTSKEPGSVALGTGDASSEAPPKRARIAPSSEGSDNAPAETTPPAATATTTSPQLPSPPASPPYTPVARPVTDALRTQVTSALGTNLADGMTAEPPPALAYLTSLPPHGARGG